jgi:hypothetical protein
MEIKHIKTQNTKNNLKIKNKIIHIRVMKKEKQNKTHNK